MEGREGGGERGGERAWAKPGPGPGQDRWAKTSLERETGQAGKARQGEDVRARAASDLVLRLHMREEGCGLVCARRVRPHRLHGGAIGAVRPARVVVTMLPALRQCQERAAVQHWDNAPGPIAGTACGMWGRHHFADRVGPLRRRARSVLLSRNPVRVRGPPPPATGGSAWPAGAAWPLRSTPADSDGACVPAAARCHHCEDDRQQGALVEDLARDRLRTRLWPACSHSMRLKPVARVCSTRRGLFPSRHGGGSVHGVKMPLQQRRERSTSRSRRLLVALSIQRNNRSCMPGCTQQMPIAARALPAHGRRTGVAAPCPHPVPT